MRELAIRKPLSALREVRALMLPEANSGDLLELTVRTTSTLLSARDMAMFLQLLDHIYGRLQPNGFRSYAMRPQEHVRLQEIRTGSVELTLLAEMVKDGLPLLTLWLCFKGLPAAAETITNAYNNYQQGMLAREWNDPLMVDKKKSII